MVAQAVASSPTVSGPGRRVRPATPHRWQSALRRALDEQVQVRQLVGSGLWIATSGTDATAAYATDGVACDCKAAEFGDPVCKHRAAYWYAMGALLLEPTEEEIAAAAATLAASVVALPDSDSDPEPVPPAPLAPVVPLWSTMLDAADGRMGPSSRDSLAARRQRRDDLDRVAA